MTESQEKKIYKQLKYVYQRQLNVTLTCKKWMGFDKA